MRMQERKKDAEIAAMHTEERIGDHRYKRDLGYKKSFTQRKDGLKSKDQIRRENLSLLTKRIEDRNRKLEAKFRKDVRMP